MISLSALQTWALVALVCALILVCTLGPMFQDVDETDDDDDPAVTVEEADDRPYNWAVDGL